MTAAFKGLASDKRYRQRYKTRAGWRYGFVALLDDDTRVYGECGSRATFYEPEDTVSFDCPAGCKRLWLVVTGASTSYLQHGWDDDERNDPHYGYSVKFDNTNVLGEADGHFTSLSAVSADAAPAASSGIYTLTGIKVSDGTDTSFLPAGFYIVGGKKTFIRR